MDVEDGPVGLECTTKSVTEMKKKEKKGKKTDWTHDWNRTCSTRCESAARAGDDI